MVYLTRRERFCAAHKLSNDHWSEDQNYNIFGKCANPNWHGHNYELFVTVKGTIQPETGWVVDLKKVSEILQIHVIEKLDHKNINEDVDFMKGYKASTEILAVKIWEQIESHIAQLGGILHCVKLQETENNFVEYFG